MSRPFPEAEAAPPSSLATALATELEPRQPRGWDPRYPPVPLVVLHVCVAAR